MLRAVFFMLFVITPVFVSAEQFVEIDGKQLEYEVAGNGDLHVLFDAGALTGMAGWDKVWEDLPGEITAFRFSRLGEGHSEACHGQRTAEQHVTEVENVIAKLNIKAPFLYVGHSLGGATARNFAARNPSRVAGMLLVDPENPRDVEIVAEIDPVKGPEEIAQIKANDYQMANGKWCFLDAIWKKEAAKDYDDIGDIPVTLIATVMQHDEPNSIFNSDLGRQRWGEIQQDWVDTFPQGQFVTTHKSGHFIQQSEPELVVRELNKLIERVKKALPSEE